MGWCELFLLVCNSAARYRRPRTRAGGRNVDFFWRWVVSKRGDGGGRGKMVGEELVARMTTGNLPRRGENGK